MGRWREEVRNIQLEHHQDHRSLEKIHKRSSDVIWRVEVRKSS